MVRWLHISDIHFEMKNYTTDVVREKFLEKVGERGKEYYKYLFITGDLLYKYENKGDFSRVKSFLEELLSISGIEKENVFIVPGNHDVKRGEMSSAYIEKITSDKMKIKDKVESIEDNEYDGLMDRQTPYIDFYNNFFNRKYDKRKLHNFIDREEISVIEINSCLLAQSNDYGKLSVDLSKLNALLLKKRIDKKIGVAILHHELEYLNDYEQDEVQKLLIEKGIDFVFCGHTHKNRYSKYTFGEKILRKFCTGTLMLNNNEEVNFVEGSFNGKEVNVIYLKWCEEFRDWRRDVYIDKSADETGVIRIKLDKESNYIDDITEGRNTRDYIEGRCYDRNVNIVFNNLQASKSEAISKKDAMIEESKKFFFDRSINISSQMIERYGTQLNSGIPELENQRVFIFPIRDFDIIDNNVYFYYSPNTRICYKHENNMWIKID